MKKHGLSRNGRIVLAAVVILLAGNSAQIASARKQRMQLPLSKETMKSNVGNQEEITLESDSILFMEMCAKLRFSGFDKKASSNKESFFVTNTSDRPVCGLRLEISYRSMADELFHKQSVILDCDVPTGETRRVDFKSWDQQKSFYYYKSGRPRNAATPFKVTFKTEAVRLR